jgi:hypothetical protein
MEFRKSVEPVLQSALKDAVFGEISPQGTLQPASGSCPRRYVEQLSA